MRKQVLVTVDRAETRVAILEAEGSPSPPDGADTGKNGLGGRGGGRSGGNQQPDWRVGELYIERRGSRSIVGNIYKGKVDNVVPGLEAAFVDIGFEKNGFLHADDVVIPGVEVARRGRAGGKGQRVSELLKPGQEILVQAVKDPLKTKGPRLSMQLSIAGRYLVYVPQGEGIGVSRRVDDKERSRLRRATAKLDLGEGGAIIRTAAQGAKKQDFDHEIKYLHKLYDVLQKRAADAVAPDMVFQEADLSVRVARDIFSGEFEKAIVDDEKQHHRLQSFFNRTAPELLERLESYDDPIEVAVLGCVVNGIGEASHADFGISGAKNQGVVFSHGKPLRKVPQDVLVDTLFAEIDKSLASGRVEFDEQESRESAEWLQQIEEENAGELTPERIAALEAQAAAEESGAQPLPMAARVGLDSSSSSTAGRRFTRA